MLITIVSDKNIYADKAWPPGNRAHTTLAHTRSLVLPEHLCTCNASWLPTPQNRRTNTHLLYLGLGKLPG